MLWVYGDNVVKRGFPMVGTIIIAINILIYLLMAGLWREDEERMPSHIKYILTNRAHSYDELEHWRRDYRDWYLNTNYHKFSEKWGAKASHLKQGHVMCLVTYMFVHGGLSHILGNMIMMWAILGTLEITLGQVRFLIAYLLWGVFAGLAHVGMEWGSDMGLVGASGAIAGMVGAYFVAFGALTKIRMVFFFGFKPIYFMIPTGVYVFLWVLSQLAGMEAESQYGGTGVAWYCHAGGFVLGISTMMLFRREVLSKLIRNKAGELQALDDEERDAYEKKLAEKAEREGLLEPPEPTTRTCPRCGYSVAPLVDKCPMCATPVAREDPAAAGLAEEDFPELPHDGVEPEPAPTGIRPWHVILGISGVMLLAAAFVATRKESPENQTVVIPSKDKEKDKPPTEYLHSGRPLSTWVDELKGDDLLKRRTAAEKLGGIDAEGAAKLAPLLAPELKSEDPDVRQLSALVLSKISLDAAPPDVVDSLVGAMKDKNRDVQGYAAFALLSMGKKKPERLAPAIQAALADPDPRVRKLGVYLHENIDPYGLSLATLNVKVDLALARTGFKTKPVANAFKGTGPAARPPADIFKTVRYDSAKLKLTAYVTPDPGDGVKRPAVLWAHGGYNGIGSYLWQASSRRNDQTASAFRAAGCVLMCPAWRNENANPGKFSLFYDELEDLLAARDYLAELPYVDPERIYIAGHDSGGTLALLAATASDQFRAVFSFGGAPDMKNYIESKAYSNIPFDTQLAPEMRLRSATCYAVAIRRPTFYFGGDDSHLAGDALLMEERAKKGGAPFQAFIIKEGSHYDILDPITRLVARKIAADKGETCNISFTLEEVQGAFNNRRK